GCDRGDHARPHADPGAGAPAQLAQLLLRDAQGQPEHHRHPPRRRGRADGRRDRLPHPRLSGLRAPAPGHGPDRDRRLARAHARMRAIAFKDHWNLTAGEAYLVQRYVDEMVRDGRLEHRVEVYGGLGLNHGINPEAVRIALQYPNFKLIWFPTFRSYGWARF